MTETQRLAALQRELAETKRALAEANLKDQRSRAIRDEIARRRLPNPASVEAMVHQQIASLEDGRLVVVDGNGVPVIGNSEGAYKTVSDLLDEVSIDWLKSSGTDTADHGRSDKNNPFVNADTARGYNMSEIMLLYKRDPETAEAMAADANFWKGIKQ
ncbi:hypothetical protein [Methylobacterium sp. SI9]|uniref:hypothetical protein n=1 Tax=Methylobacterium guangdongense TaxID=3138811 RepID=UPI00313B629D